MNCAWKRASLETESRATLEGHDVPLARLQCAVIAMFVDGEAPIAPLQLYSSLSLSHYIFASSRDPPLWTGTDALFLRSGFGQRGTQGRSVVRVVEFFTGTICTIFGPELK